MHVAALVAWVGSAVAGHAATARARSAGETERGLHALRRVRPILTLEHAALAVLILSGAALMRQHGWGLGHSRWLGLKLGLVVFLVVPLEAMHAYIWHVWIARGLRDTPAPPFSRGLSRGLGVDEMIRALAAVLLGVGLPLLVWLSLAKPF